MSLLDIVKSKKIKIIYLVLLVIIIFSLLERDHKDKDEVVQAFNYFIDNRDFTSIEFEIHTKGPLLERRVMSVDEIERLWTIIKNANPGSGPKRDYDILIIAYFHQKDGTTTTIYFRKDLGVDLVRIGFNLTGTVGYSLNGVDHEGIIDELVRLAMQ